MKKNYEYKNTDGHLIKVTVTNERIYVSAPYYGAESVEAYPHVMYEGVANEKHILLCVPEFRVHGARFGVQPPTEIMSEIMSLINYDHTKAAYDERRRAAKSAEWVKNYGKSAYNPYAS